jgi:hypothetical protein
MAGTTHFGGKLQRPANTCQHLPTPAIRCQHLQRAAIRCKDLQRPAKRCETVQTPARLQSAAKRFQSFSFQRQEISQILAKLAAR